MRDLENKTAFITGAAGGIGLGIARALADCNMRIVVADIDVSGAEAALRELKTAGANAIALPIDVSDLDSFRAAVDEAERQFGPIEVMCSNAGVVGAPRMMYGLEGIEPADWDWLMAVNLGGAFNAFKTILPRMIARDTESHIVVTGSVAGLLPQPGAPLAYATSKYAVRGLCEQLWTDLAGLPRIGISLLCPGVVDTQFGANSARLAPDGPPPARPPSLEEQAAHEAIMASSIDADTVGEHVRDGIRAGDRYIFTNPEYKSLLAAYQADILTYFSPPKP